jgi:hypothetical protein
MGYPASMTSILPTTTKVLNALQRAGWGTANLYEHSEMPDGIDLTDADEAWRDILAAIGSGLLSELELNNDIGWVVRSYLLNKVAAISPKVYRRELRQFKKVLGILIEKIPASHSPIDFAIKEKKWIQELYENDQDCSPCDQKNNREPLRDHRFGVERLQSDLIELCEIVGHLIDEESGPGRDASRAERRLIDGLARIFHRLTGKIPTRNSDPQSKCESSSPFHSFVEAVEELLPADFALSDIDNLIRHHLERTFYPLQAS